MIVVILPDSGRAYLSTYFNDRWLLANGFADADGAALAELAAIDARGDAAVPKAGSARRRGLGLDEARYLHAR